MNIYEIILDVCETKSISRTAERLTYTPSAISQAIRGYEEELGIRLFNRSKKGMEVRSEAAEIIASLQSICMEERRIREAAAELTSLEKGDLRIGSIQSISYSWLPNILSRFSEEYPNLQFTLQIENFQELYHMLQADELDCIFTSEFAAPNTAFLPLYKDELSVVMPTDHRLSGQMSVAVEELSGEPFLLSADGLAYETGLIFKENGIEPDIRYRLNDDFTVCNMVEKGYGIAVLSKLLLSRIPFDVCIRPFKAHYYRMLGIACPAREKRSQALTQFIDNVVQWKKENDQQA